MLFLMAINLYTSRIILQALGVENYGIYNAIAGFITMFSMISASLSTSISRYITFILGKGDFKQLNTVFNTSIVIQICLSGIIIFLVETVGVWFLNHHMTIPSDSIIAANWVLQFSLITFVINLLSIPYNALLIAHEHMSAFAYIGIFEGCVNLVIAFIILYTTTNTLILYSVLLCLTSLIIRLIYTFYCKKNFKEAHFKWKFDLTLLKDMFGFAGWNFLGNISGILRSQGINILFNIYNGPVVNAARGLAVQVNTAVTKFSTNFYTAVQPQITKYYANKQVSESNLLVLRSARLAFFMLMLISIPIIFNVDLILKIWLKEVPTHTNYFIIIIIINSLYDSFSQPLIHLMLATGNIKKYQITIGLINLMNFPIAWIILKLNLAPEIAQSSVILFTIIALIARLALLKTMTGLSPKEFIKNTIIKCSLIFIICCICPLIISLTITDNLMRLIIDLTAAEIISLAIIYLLGLSPNERKFMLSKIKVRNKING